MKTRSPALLVALLLASCSQSPPPKAAPGTKTAAEQNAPSEKAPADKPGEKAPAAKAEREITVQMVDVEAIRAAVAKHKGKVVVMDAWATWCPPCVAEFPNLVELHKKYGPDKVACVSLSFDDPPDQEKVLSFLKAKGAHFDNLQTKVDPDVLFTEFKIPALPAVFVYGTDGELVKMADGHKAYEEVIPLVEKLVKGGQGAQP